MLTKSSLIINVRVVAEFVKTAKIAQPTYVFLGDLSRAATMRNVFEDVPWSVFYGPPQIWGKWGNLESWPSPFLTGRGTIIPPFFRNLTYCRGNEITKMLPQTAVKRRLNF